MDPLTLFALANGAVAAVKKGCQLYKDMIMLVDTSVTKIIYIILRFQLYLRRRQIQMPMRQ
jgi:hypothetical protein